MTLFPLRFRQIIGDLEHLVERVRGDDFGIVIEVRVNIRRRSNVGMPEPFLDLLHRHAVGEHQRRAGVPQIVKADLPQSVLLQEPPERFGDPVRFKELSHLIHENVSVVFVIVAVAADALVYRLLFLQSHEPFLELTDKRHGAKTGIRFRFVRLNEDPFAVQFGTRHGVPYRDRAALEDGENGDDLRKMFSVMMRVRKLFKGDYYQLTPVTPDDRDWFAYRLHIKEIGEGAVISFRRGSCPMNSANYQLTELDLETEYLFEDLFGDRSFTATGAYMAENGLDVSLKKRRSVSVIHYEPVV